MEIVVYFILIALPFVLFVYRQKVKRIELPDEELTSETKTISEETGELLDIVAHPYSPHSNRVVFLSPHEIQWWDSLPGNKKKEVYNSIQKQIKEGKLKKVYDDQGKLIGMEKC